MTTALTTSGGCQSGCLEVDYVHSSFLCHKKEFRDKSDRLSSANVLFKAKYTLEAGEQTTSERERRGTLKALGFGVLWSVLGRLV